MFYRLDTLSLDDEHEHSDEAPVTTGIDDCLSNPQSSVR